MNIKKGDNIGGLVGNSAEETSISSAFISDLTMNIETGNSIGGLIGNITKKSTIISPLVSGLKIDIKKTGNRVGGLLGYNTVETTISSASVSDLTMEIKKGDYIGGVAGRYHVGDLNDPVVKNINIKMSEGNYIGGMLGIASTKHILTNPKIETGSIEVINDTEGNSKSDDCKPADICKILEIELKQSIFCHIFEWRNP